MTSEGIPATLKTPQASQQRRGSFLYRSETNEAEGNQQQYLTTPSISVRSHSSTSSISASPTYAEHTHPEEAIITPFAQILQRLQIARNSYVELTKVTDKRRRRSSNYNSEAIREVNYMSSPNPNKYPEEFCLEILDDLDWCLDQLEAIQTNKSVGDLATTKFKKILTKELNQLAESSRSGSLISEYISNTFLDKEEEPQLEANSVPPPLPAPPSTTAASATTATTTTTSVAAAAATTTKVAAVAAAAGLRTIRCDIPGVRKLTQAQLPKLYSGDDEPLYGVVNMDEEAVGKHMVNMHQWNFDIFKLDEVTNGQCLTVMAYTIFKERNLFATFHIPPATMVTYLNHIQAHYDLESFYHNRMHAADVTHAVHVILNKAPQLAIFSDLEVLSALFAAVIHDVDHPGVTNPYLINTNSDLALMYNDESILENHHLAVAFKLLQERNCDIFVNLPPRKRQRIRKMAIDMVLATDMTKHMRLVADLKTKVETKKLSGVDLLVTDNYNERIEVLKCLLHCADLGNPTKSLDIYNKWVNRVMREFFNQGDIERNLGLEISPMCDRYTASVEKSQVSFIEYIVHPLWETWAELVDPYCNDILDIIEDNRNHFQNLAAQNCTSPIYKQQNQSRLQNSEEKVNVRGGESETGGGLTVFGFETDEDQKDSGASCRVGTRDEQHRKEGNSKHFGENISRKENQHHQYNEEQNGDRTIQSTVTITIEKD